MTIDRPNFASISLSNVVVITYIQGSEGACKKRNKIRMIKLVFLKLNGTSDTSDKVCHRCAIKVRANVKPSPLESDQVFLPDWRIKST